MAMTMDQFHPRLTENSKSWTFLEQRGWVGGAAKLLDYEASGGIIGIHHMGGWIVSEGEMEGKEWRKGGEEERRK